MKLILNVEIANDEFVYVEILDSKIEEIDRFTTYFSNKKQLFDEIIKSSKNIDSEFIKYSFYIKTSRGDILPVLYHDYSFITDDLMRRNASIKIMKLDPERVYRYIEENHYNYLLKELPEDADKRYKFDPVYGLYKLLEKNNYKIDANYYNYFKKNIEGNYRVLRDMIRCILTEEEKNQIGYNVSITDSKIGFICLKANLNLQKTINEKLEKNKNRSYSISIEEDDIDE